MPRTMPKFTRTPPELIAAFDAAKPDHPGVTRKLMFGYPAYFLRGNMFAFTFGPRVAIRAGAARRAKLKDGGVFEVIPGRPMREYVEVPASGLKGRALTRWIAEGLANAAELPTKTSPKKTASSSPKRTASSRPKKTAGTKR